MTFLLVATNWLTSCKDDVIQIRQQNPVVQSPDDSIPVIDSAGTLPIDSMPGDTTPPAHNPFSDYPAGDNDTTLEIMRTINLAADQFTGVYHLSMESWDGNYYNGDARTQFQGDFDDSAQGEFIFVPRAGAVPDQSNGNAVAYKATGGKDYTDNNPIPVDVYYKFPDNAPCALNVEDGVKKTSRKIVRFFVTEGMSINLQQNNPLSRGETLQMIHFDVNKNSVLLQVAQGDTHNALRFDP